MARIRTIVIVILFVTLWASLAFAQESLQTAKDLYASAAYDDALGVLGRLRGNELRPDVEQYRVMCLVALGRQAEAEATAQTIVKSHPDFALTSSEVSPRIQDLFTRTRKRLLPEISRAMYLDAKAAFERKDRQKAIERFDAVVRLIDVAESPDDESLVELRLLASGFLDLAKASPEPAAELANKPVGTPAEESAKAVRPKLITPPVAVRQTMPQWVPSDGLSRSGSFAGAIRVSISADGTVASAKIERSVHPAYDRLLLQAAQSWTYQPARNDGLPVPSEQLVQVQLRPRQ